MKARLALLQPERRFVWNLRRKQNSTELSELWLAFTWDTPNWEGVFGAMFELLAIPWQARADVLEIGNGAGEIRWRRHWCWTEIALRLVKFSERKQQLVAAALVKAARCNS